MVAAGSITVAVRVRPPTAWEAARLPEPCYETVYRGEGTLSTPRSVANTATLRDVVQIVDDRILTFDPDEKDRAKAFVERGFLPPGTKRYKDKRFMFDRVFNHEARQQDVYEATSQPLLSGLLDGFNATVFAYGATGCGKTHTISGTESDPGIIYLTMADLFQRIEDRRDEWNVEVMVTFLEIYNEEIRDLLAEPGTTQARGGLSIREDKGVKVVGLVEATPRTAEEVKEIVLQGNLRRTQSPTHANETSSRSHAVLQIHVTQSPRTASLSEQNTVATLSIIDLAGSERAAATTNMGQRMVEGANINKSLLALGNCINALCESGGATRHIPYRNSKLTRLLKFSLGGNCKTVMIVCVAPTSNHFDDTHNTLVYADRATKIKTKVVTRNVVNVDRHVGRYVEAINKLNVEIAELKAKIAGKNFADNDVIRRKRAEATAEVERAKKDVEAKVEQTKGSIVDGAACNGKLSVAKIKLDVIRTRLGEIEASGNGTLSADMEAERALLHALAKPDEQAVKSDSALAVRAQRSSNSNAMFDATMRVVAERKSDKLDDVSVQNVKLFARTSTAEMEKLKAEAERDAMRLAVEDMAEVVVKLVGALGRCTVIVGEAANALGGGSNQDGGDGVSQTARKVGGLLGCVKEKNDDMFKKLVGHSTEGYVVATPNLDNLDVFKGYSTTFTRRVSSGPPVLQQQTDLSMRGPSSRRSSTSAYGALTAEAPRRAFKSPRKSLRSSISSQPYRRVSDKEKRGKSVQWRDEAGQGSLDDGGPKTSTNVALKAVTVTVIPASPASASENTSVVASSSRASTPTQRGLSLASESDWEDENDKPDDSVTASFTRSLPASTRDLSLNSSTSSLRSFGKRPRASRLDPSFLKAKSRTEALGSLAERDEDGSPERRTQHPLSDLSVNHLSCTSEDSTSSSETQQSGNSLHIPKGKERRLNGSPGKRVPATPRSVGALNASKGHGGSRRRSNIGPVRVEKSRRRSSMIPQLSPVTVDQGNKTSTRRAFLASPAKRSKRPSLTRTVGTGSTSHRLKPIAAMASMSSISSLSTSSLASADPNTSTELSAGGNRPPRPTWR